MAERNLHVDHVTIWRWVQRYAPELNRRCRQELRPTNGSWRVDETYLRVAGKWTYLYRAVDSTGCAYRKFHLWAEAVAHKAANQLSGHALLHGTIVKHEKSCTAIGEQGEHFAVGTAWIGTTALGIGIPEPTSPFRLRVAR